MLHCELVGSTKGSEAGGGKLGELKLPHESRKNPGFWLDPCQRRHWNLGLHFNSRRKARMITFAMQPR